MALSNGNFKPRSPRELASILVHSFIDLGCPADMIQDYAYDLSSENDAVIAAVEALATEGNLVGQIVEAAKDMIDQRHREATEDYEYLGAKADGLRSRQG